LPHYLVFFRRSTRTKFLLFLEPPRRVCASGS
jgi:hypothetical protein